jgi:hypothetical protein
LVLFPTLGQGCDDLVVCARPTLMAKQTELGSLAYPPEGKKDCSGVESSKGRRFDTSAHSGESVFLSAMMTMSGVGFDYGGGP